MPAVSGLLLAFDVGNTNTVIGLFDGKHLTRHWRLTTAAERTSDEYGILMWSLFQAVGGMEKWFATLAGEAGLTGQRIGFESNDLTVSTFQAMKKSLEAIPAPDRPKLLAAPAIVQELRVIKDADEIAALQRAVDIGDAAFNAVAGRIEPGWTENQIAWEIEKHARE